MERCVISSDRCHGRPTTQVCDLLGFLVVVTDSAVSHNVWQQDTERRVISGENFRGVRCHSAELVSAVHCSSCASCPGHCCTSCYGGSAEWGVETRWPTLPLLPEATEPALPLLPVGPDAPWPSADNFCQGTNVTSLFEDTKSHCVLHFYSPSPRCTNPRCSPCQDNGKRIYWPVLLLKPTLVRPQRICYIRKQRCQQPHFLCVPGQGQGCGPVLQAMEPGFSALSVWVFKNLCLARLLFPCTVELEWLFAEISVFLWLHRILDSWIISFFHVNTLDVLYNIQ